MTIRLPSPVWPPCANRSTPSSTEVMVMADDEALKANRLALLNNLRNLFLQVADISLLQ